MTDKNQQPELHRPSQRQIKASEYLPVQGLAPRLWIQQARSELWQNILPFWIENSIDSLYGGFVGRMSNEKVADTGAAKGLVLNARLLWTFSKIHQLTQNPDYLKLATRAFDYILAQFWDSRYGGAFWSLNPDGSVLNPCKKTYGQAFLIYAMSEYYRATGNEQAMDTARQVFNLLEEHVFDPIHLGYIEVCDRDWTVSEDQRLGSEDMNEKKSMNNHLHLLEAFSNFCSIRKEPAIIDRFVMLLELFDKKIVNPNNGHLDLFFDNAWNRKSGTISFGHDIEASWLLCEAADVLGDPGWIQKTRTLSARMAQTAYEKALDNGGGLCHEIDEAGRVNRVKEFWCQAEATIGFINAFQITQKKHFYQAAAGVWNFIRDKQVDKEHGEWFLRVDPDNRPIRDLPKISEWKDPYHNCRCCIELIERLTSLLKTPSAPGVKEALVYE